MWISNISFKRFQQGQSRIKVQNVQYQIWHYESIGTGRPIILLHGIGMSHAVWNPVIPFLAKSHRVIAVDIAGFGKTPSLPDNIVSTISHLVDGLEHTLKAIGITEPVDVVGNSLGGIIALEAAKRGIARSVVAISPGGLWKKHIPPIVKWFLMISYRIAKILPSKFFHVLLKSSIIRELIFMIPISRGSRVMRTQEAIRLTTDISKSSAFKETLNEAGAFHGGQSITIPITIAFGKRDYLLTKRSRLRDELPKHTKWVEPEKWGHVPMWIDPEGVAKFILEGIA